MMHDHHVSLRQRIVCAQRAALEEREDMGRDPLPDVPTAAPGLLAPHDQQMTRLGCWVAAVGYQMLCQYLCERRERRERRERPNGAKCRTALGRRQTASDGGRSQLAMQRPIMNSSAR